MDNKKAIVIGRLLRKPRTVMQMFGAAFMVTLLTLTHGFAQSTSGTDPLAAASGYIASWTPTVQTILLGVFGIIVLFVLLGLASKALRRAGR